MMIFHMLMLGQKRPQSLQQRLPRRTSPKLISRPTKNLKKVIQGGGKGGVKIEGAADMGGHQYFCTSVDESQGDLNQMDHCIAAMNAQTVPGEEECNWCSCQIGKMIFSVGDHQLAVVAHVPEVNLMQLSG